MKAVVAHGPGDFRVDEVPEPERRAGAVIDVEAAGVCAADRMIWRGDGPWELTYPFTPGHEILGRIAWVDDVSGRLWNVRVGDRVTAEVMVPCRLCRAGRENLCRFGTHLGSGLPGACAERMAVPPEALVHEIPIEVSVTAAVLTEPAACATHAVRRAGLERDDVVAVAGIGAIGACALGVIAGRVRRVVAVTTSSTRAELALALGADDALDLSSLTHDVASDVLAERAGGGGPDVFIDCSGSTDAVALGLAAVIPGGRVVLDGVYRRRADVDLNVVAEHKELDVRGAHLAPGAFPEAIELLRAGAIDADAIVTHRYALGDVAGALEPAPDGDRLKAILVP